MASLIPRENNEPSRICQVQKAADSESRPRATPREEKKEKGGYECEFVEPPPKQLQSECSICLLVLREPHIVSCCGYSFCETCIERIQKDGKPCPLCNEPGFMGMANKHLKRTLNEFQVRCPHRELGCEWVGELGKLDQHLNADPQPEHQLEGCQFTSIECIHCKDHMRRHVIAGHQNEHCPKRPYTCEYCEEYDSTFEGVANHWAECKCCLLLCPNNCELSRSGIKRQNLEHHMKEECPLTVVECDFHYAGCGVKLPRKDVAVHMKEESMAHISLLAAENQRLAKQLVERDEQVQQLQESIHQIIQWSNKLTHSINQQQEANYELRQELTQMKHTLRQQQRAHQELVEKMDQQQKASQEAMEIVTLRREELAQTVQQQQTTHHELASKVAVLVHGQQQKEGLRQKSEIMPTDIKMAGFRELKDTNTRWYSLPFYTHMCGYKMCLSIDANGNDDNIGTHVSVFTCLMCGEFDSDLKWPFRGVITIQLLNQLKDREHRTYTIHYTDTMNDDLVGQVTVREKANGLGFPQFIPHSQLNFNRAKNCQYLKDDCLIFRVLSMKIQ